MSAYSVPEAVAFLENLAEECTNENYHTEAGAISDLIPLVKSVKERHGFTVTAMDTIESFIVDPTIKPRFTLDPLGKYSKHAILNDSKGWFYAYVDTDDVPRDEALDAAQIICDILNENADRIPHG